MSKDLNTPPEQISENAEALLDICNELKRGLSRLSYVGMGLTDELDKELATLRKVIKQDGEINEIKSVINNISKILRTLDDDTNHKEIDKPNQKLDLLSILLKNQLPKSLKKNLKKVKKKSSSDDAATVIRSIAEVIRSYVDSIETDLANHLQEKIPTKKKGFIASLFSKKVSEEDPLSERVKEKPELIAIGNEDTTRLPQKVKDSLQLLIDQLSSMDGYSEIASVLNTEISKIKKIEQLSLLLEMITNAFIEISDQEHVQFEEFLKTLNTRIVRVNDFIDKTLKYSQNSNTDSQQLNLDLNNNLTQIKETLTNSDSIDDAKLIVFSHMDDIVGQINQYLSHVQSK